jgi:hypothetical protein
MRLRSGLLLPLEPPPSLLVQRVVDGVRQDMRQLNVAVFERAVITAVGRGLLDQGDRGKPWTVTNALFAGMFTDHTIHWLHKRVSRVGRSRQGRGDHRGHQRSDRTATVKALSVRDHVCN